MKMKIVKLIWHDACDDEPWTNIKTLKPLVEVTTVGLLVRKTKEVVSVANSMYGSQVGGIIHIPRGCVKSIEYLCEA